MKEVQRPRVRKDIAGFTKWILGGALVFWLTGVTMFSFAMQMRACIEEPMPNGRILWNDAAFGGASVMWVGHGQVVTGVWADDSREWKWLCGAAGGFGLLYHSSLSSLGHRLHKYCGLDNPNSCVESEDYVPEDSCVALRRVGSWWWEVIPQSPNPTPFTASGQYTGVPFDPNWLSGIGAGSLSP